MYIAASQTKGPNSLRPIIENKEAKNNFLITKDVYIHKTEALAFAYAKTKCNSYTGKPNTLKLSELEDLHRYNLIPFNN
jgi:hypothetical protein